MRLRDQFEKESELSWLNDQGEPDIEYVEWLISDFIPWCKKGVNWYEVKEENYMNILRLIKDDECDYSTIWEEK